MLDRVAYAIGLMGVWLVSDGLISIRIYLTTVDDSGERIQNWRYDHSIRVIRIAIGIALIMLGGL